MPEWLQIALEQGSASAPWSATLGGIDVRFGRGSRAGAPEAMSRHRVSRPLLVTDAGVRASGWVEEIAATLRASGLQPEIFDAVSENPTTDDVDSGLAAARQHAADGFLAVGGGSAMDTAKGINFLLTNGGRMEDYEGKARARQAMLPSVGIPTTAGTGSEAQSFALISRAEDHRKMACGDPKARFRTVLLDPELLSTVPAAVAAAAGIDAVAHAVESHVSRAANATSRSYSGAAWSLLRGALGAYLKAPADGGAAARMMLGAHLAGAAIECSMLGAAHACANPLTAAHGITHGIAVGVMLPHVMRFNGGDRVDLYDDLDVDASDRVAELLAVAGIAPRLRQHGVTEAELPRLATQASKQWTAGFNPRPVGEAELLEIYRHAY